MILIIHTQTHIKKHKDCSYAYKVVCCYDDKYSKPLQLCRGPDVVYKLIERMLEEQKWCKKTQKKNTLTNS